MTRDSFDPFGLDLDRDRALAILRQAVAGADDGELFLERSVSETLVYDDGRLRNAGYDASQGFGLRAVRGEVTGFAHSTEISLAALPETEPVAMPPATEAKLITVTDTSVITPFVVSVLLAQRRLALVTSRTIAMQSSAVEVASACSTSCCAVLPGEVVISCLPRRWC